MTYLSLRPPQRGGREFPREKVSHWKSNFPAMTEFLAWFAEQVQAPMPVERDELMYFHMLRNEVYHAGNGLVPSRAHVDGARAGAVWTLSLLFDIDAEALLSGNGVTDDVPIDEVSAQTALLEQFISLRRKVDELFVATNKAPDAAMGILTRVQQAESEGIIDVSGLDSELAEVDEIKRKIVNGEQVDVSEEHLRDLVGKLGALSERFQKQLRDVQRSMSEAAFRAALKLRARGGVAGLVIQATGTGMTMSVMAYLLRCRESVELGQIHHMVLCDRRSVAHQLAARSESMMRDYPLMDMVAATGIDQLTALLAAPSPCLVVTTVQQIRSAAMQVVETPTLITFVQHVPSAALQRELLRRFPSGIFVTFASVPPNDRELVSDRLGPVIGTYELREAISDGFLRPPIVEYRRLRALVDGTFGHGGRAVEREPTKLPDISVFAREASLDFSRRIAAEGEGGALILVENRSVAEAMVSALNAELVALHTSAQMTPKVGVLYPGDLSAINQTVQRFDGSGAPVILVLPIRLLDMHGVDIKTAKYWYVACRVPEAMRERVLSAASRLARPENDSTVVIDYADNVWT